PNSKKSSSMLTHSTRSNSLQIPAKISSTGVRGLTKSLRCPSDHSGAGRAFRSTFPFAVSGSPFTLTYLLGTMYSGSLSPTYSRSPSSPLPSSSFHTTYPTSRFSPPSSSRATTTTSLTPSYPRITSSISPTSTRCPRTFTCSSRLPTYSTSPPSTYPPTSPVLYIRLPAPPPHRSATTPSALRSPRSI